MTDSGHIDDLVAPYALGALEPEELQRVEAHLATCPSCRQAVAEAKEVTDWLAYAAPPVAPPAHLRGELLRRLPQPASMPAAPVAPPRRAWWTGSWFRPALVAASLVTIVVLASTAITMQQALQAEREQKQALAPSATKEAQLSMMVLAPEATTVTLRSPDGSSPASGKLLIHSGQGQAMLVVQRLPALRSGLAYQVWFAHEYDQRPAATFHVNDDGAATIEVALPENMVEYRWLWVTIEPAGGSREPTGAKVLDGWL